MYCGSELNGELRRDANYTIKECPGCRKEIEIRNDLNDLGNGDMEDLDEKVKDMIKNMFLGPTVF